MKDNYFYNTWKFWEVHLEIGLVGYMILYHMMENKYMYHNFQ